MLPNSLGSSLYSPPRSRLGEQGVDKPLGIGRGGYYLLWVQLGEQVERVPPFSIPSLAARLGGSFESSVQIRFGDILHIGPIGFARPVGAYQNIQRTKLYVPSVRSE